MAKDFRPYMHDLQLKIQKTRTNFDDYSSKLKKRMAEVQKQYLDEPVRNTRGKKEGYLFLLEKSEVATDFCSGAVGDVCVFQRRSALRGPNIFVPMIRKRKSSRCYRTIN